MKSTAWLLFSTFIAISPASAQSPREQMNLLLTVLRATPGDTATRERIIRLAQEIKPAPAVPEEAERRLGRGQAAFEIAKEPADFERAIAEFTAASNEAPWLAAPYYNLGVVQEKAKKYREAIASFRLYLLAAPGSPDTSEIRQRVFKLEFLAEQPPPAPTDAELLATLNGARFKRTDLQVGVLDSRGDSIWEINGQQLTAIQVVRQLGPQDARWNQQILNTMRRDPQPDLQYKGKLRWEFSRTVQHPCNQIPNCTYWVQVSPDGRSLTYGGFAFGTMSPYTQVYPRE